MPEKETHQSKKSQRQPGERVDEEFGLGRLVKTTVPKEVRKEHQERSDSDEGISEVGEASRESFPGSDPPSFRGTSDPE